MRAVFVAFFLLTLLVVRFFLNDTSVSWINTICFLGLLVATIDLLVLVFLNTNHNRRYYTIIIIIVIIIILLVVVQALIFSGVIFPDNKANEIFTLLTLFLSLPKETYINIINNYIKGGGQS